MMTRFPFDPIYDKLSARKLHEVTQKPSGKRFYTTPSGLIVPSITTVISAQPKPELDEWRARVGDAQADATSRYARDRGTALHAHAEDHILGRDHTYTDIFDKLLFL